MATDKLPIIAIVVPCYNEEKALPLSVPKMLEILERLNKMGLADKASYILLCNDGSKDRTWGIIERLHLQDTRIKGISLAHNRGHQNVLLAGLMTAKDHCDAAISIDADLQDDPEAIISMVHKFHEGKEIVYGVRSSRETDTWLMSNRALDLLSQYGESNLFLRGIIPQIGLKNAIVTYARSERVAGESKYPFTKMLSFSIDGITSFSARPMRWIFMTGIVLLAVDILVALYVLISYFFSDHISAGWASLMLSIWALGSMILIAIGVVGEYIGKIFIEVKHRPRYAISDRLWD